MAADTPEALNAELLAVLDGRRSLRIADVNGDAPFVFSDIV